MQTDGQPPGGSAPSSRLVLSFVSLFVISFHVRSWPLQLIIHRFVIFPLLLMIIFYTKTVLHLYKLKYPKNVVSSVKM